jgi:hypothetical protein
MEACLGTLSRTRGKCSKNMDSRLVRVHDIMTHHESSTHIIIDIMKECVFLMGRPWPQGLALPEYIIIIYIYIYIYTYIYF